MVRIFKNKTASEALVTCGNTTQVVPANDQFDLASTFTGVQLQTSTSLIELLGQGVDKFQLNEGVNDLSVSDAIDLIRNIKEPVPKTEDGRPISMPQSFEKGVFFYMTGAGDHATNGRGEGQPFRVQRSTSGDSVVEWQFDDWVKLVGGSGRYTGGVFGDDVSFSCYAPATQVEAATPGEGSVVLVDTGVGFNVIVPHPTGTHNIVAGTEVPVPPSIGEQAFWDWSCPDEGKGTVTPAEHGHYNLYDGVVPLSRHAPRLQLLGSGSLEIGTENVEPLIVLPQWKGKMVLHNEGGSHEVSVVWELKLVRKRTTQEW